MIEAYYVDLLPSVRANPAQVVDLDLTQIRKHNIVTALSLEQTKRVYPAQVGYIAGTQDGIVTVNGVAKSRQILVMEAHTQDFAWVARVYSLDNGHYLIDDLDPNKQYLIMCRDLPPDGVNQRYEPFCWDYVVPATDLTLDEQQALWQSWQQT